MRDYRAALDAGYADEWGVCHFNLARHVAKRGHKADALALLRVAIDRDPLRKVRAAEDECFASLWEEDRFKQLCSVAATTTDG
ncbi:MAG: hypothetical protein H6716_17065 [Polyangiaceae bacterium]|nr:hypothetical protein [Polyangiaceae bacterium]